MQAFSPNNGEFNKSEFLLTCVWVIIKYFPPTKLCFYVIIYDVYHLNIEILY